MSVEPHCKNKLTYQILDLTAYFNNDGISFDTDRTDGDFSGFGATYPAEDLPASNSRVLCHGVPFLFPGKSDGLDNNVALEGQHISVPADLYDSLFLLGAADENSHEDVISFEFASGRRQEGFLGLSSWRLRHNLRYGELVAFECGGYHFRSHHVYTNRVRVDYGMWLQSLPIDSTECLSYMELPDNPGMHIFAMTLRRAGQG